MDLRMMFVILTCLLCVLGLSIVHGEHIYIPGNLTVVGMFGIYNPRGSGCGEEISVTSVMSAEAVKWYIRRQNEAGDLPINIGFEGYKTCRQASLAAKVAIDTISRSLGRTDDEIIAGVIGPEFSSEAEVVSPILSSVTEGSRIVQISYSATAAGLADDGTYPNFIRVTPNDDTQIEVMVQSMHLLGWNRVAIVHENNVYGNDGARALKLRAEISSICVSYTGSIDIEGGVDLNKMNVILNDITVGTSETKSFKGFVFFGTTTTANILFTVLKTMPVSNVPVVMLSEGVNLYNGAFQNSNDEIFEISKGSYIVSPSYTEITEFKQHWQSIFADEDIFNKESASNPWLIPLYKKITGCATKECQFAALSNADLKMHFGDQPLFIQYAITAAGILTKAINQNYRHICGNITTPCSVLNESFRSGDIITAMKNITFSDFGIPSLDAVDGTIYIDKSGERQPLPTKTTYQMFNFRDMDHPLSNSEFSFVKVGEYADGHMDIDTSAIRDYSSNGDALEWPNVRKAICEEGFKCDQCIPSDLSERDIHVPGDAYVVGIVPIYNNDDAQDCTSSIRSVNGYQLAESLTFGIEQFSTGQYKSYFPNIKIGLVVLNSCDSPTVINRKILNLHQYGLRLNDGTYISMQDKIIGYIGPLSSTLSIAVSKTLQILKQVQISYASTTSSLGDRSEHPFFMRVVTPDDVQAFAIMKIVEELKSDYIQIVYSEGAYGEGLKESIDRKAADNNVCVIQAIEVEKGSDYYTYYERLRKYPHAKIVIVALHSDVVDQFFKSMVTFLKQGDFVFIGSEAWAKRSEVLSEDTATHVTLGSFTLVIEMVPPDTLTSHIRSIKPETFNANPWVSSYLQEKLNCYYTNSFDKTKSQRCEEIESVLTDPNFEIDIWATAAYNSLLSLLIGGGAHFESTCGKESKQLCSAFLKDKTGLVEQIKKNAKLDLYGTGSTDKVFDDNGDGNVGYIIYHIEKSPDNPQELVYRKVGQYPRNGQGTLNLPTEIPSTCPNQQACEECLPAVNVTEQADQKKEDIGLIVLGSLFGITTLTVIILALIICKMKRSFKHSDNGRYITASPSYDRSDAVGENIATRPRRCKPTIETTNNGTYFNPSPSYDRPDVVGENIGPRPRQCESTIETTSDL